MKYTIILSIFFLTLNLTAQEGKFTGTVFFDYTNDMTDGVEISSFNLNRAYLGYKHTFDKEFSSEIKMDVGRISDHPKDDRLVAYLKTAYFTWKGVFSKIDLNIGLHGMKMFGIQEKFWGYRYIYKSFMDQNKYGSSADMGFTFKAKPSDKFTLYATAVNGEGYKHVQDGDGHFKYALTAETHFTKELTALAYFDTKSIEGLEAQNVLALFAGYKHDKIRFGAEYNTLANQKGVKDENLDGLSFYATYTFNKNVEAFVRYDKLSSKDDFNLSKDGNTMLIGLQYKKIDNVKLAINYVAFDHDDDAKTDTKMFRLNVQVKI